MKKIVINACFGGFSLSMQGVKRWAEIKGIPCHFFYQPDFDGPYVPCAVGSDLPLDLFWAFKTPNPNQDLPKQGEDWHGLSLEDRQESNRKFSEMQISCCDIPRDDSALVQVVEEMGEAANGRCAKLEIVEIPDDVDWEIAEYDGNEHIAEKHRTWG